MKYPGLPAMQRAEAAALFRRWRWIKVTALRAARQAPTHQHRDGLYTQAMGVLLMSKGAQHLLATLYGERNP